MHRNKPGRDDLEAVWRAAVRCPRLPARAPARMLEDSGTAAGAARNPALPLAVMRRLTGPDRS